MKGEQERLTKGKAIKFLRAVGYDVGRIATPQIFPNVYDLPDDYPWTYGPSGDSGPVKGRGDSRVTELNHPVACAALHFNGTMELYFPEELSVARYHKQLIEILDLDEDGFVAR